MVRYSRHRKGRKMRSVDEALGSSGNQLRYMFGDIGIFGFKPFEIYDQIQYMNDYMKNRGLTWNDMKYPTLAKHAGGSGNGLSYNWKAIKRLYK